LESGIEQLKPLVLKNVAQELGIHESTVSRAIAGKYAQTPQGILALKGFFAHGLPITQGQGVASKTLKAWIQEILSQESINSPLSDIEITKRLIQAKGVSVARRTVAKYRKEMGLGASSSRKG
jgi:RNA polymerase sigma-54 factor